MIAQAIRHGSAVGLLLGTLAAALPANAQTVGSVVRDVVEVAGKQVPLPAGDFTVLSVDNVPARLEKGETVTERLDLGPIRSVTLAQILDGRVATVVEIAANMIPYHDGWGTTADCTRKDLYAAISRYKSGWDVSCLYLKPVAVAADTAGPGGAALAPFARAGNANVTDFWVAAGLRSANRQDVVDVRYYVDPAALGVPATAAAAAGWQPAVIEQDPGRLEVVKTIAAWVGTAAEPLDRGLRGRLESAALPAIAGAGALDPSEIERAARVEALRKLREANAISDEELQRQLADVDASAAAAAAAAAGGWTYAQVAGWKAFTYRVVVTTINAGIDYVFIGRPFAAGVLVVLQVVVNTTKFFFHEMMWQELFGISPLQRDAPSVIEFGRIVTASAN